MNLQNSIYAEDPDLRSENRSPCSSAGKRPCTSTSVSRGRTSTTVSWLCTNTNTNTNTNTSGSQALQDRTNTHTSRSHSHSHSHSQLHSHPATLTQDLRDLGGTVCRDTALALKHHGPSGTVVLLPRVAQHHCVPPWLSARIANSETRPGVRLLENPKYAPVACLHWAGDTEAEPLPEPEPWRFAQESEAKSERLLLCNYCYGKNWVGESRWNEHLLLGHGVDVEAMAYLPTPLAYRARLLRKGSRVQHTEVRCPRCPRWVKLGQAPAADAGPITGFYENYFRHVLCHLASPPSP